MISLHVCQVTATVQHSKMTTHIKRAEYVTEHQDKQTTKIYPKKEDPHNRANKHKALENTASYVQGNKITDNLNRTIKKNTHRLKNSKYIPQTILERQNSLDDKIQINLRFNMNAKILKQTTGLSKKFGFSVKWLW